MASGWPPRSLVTGADLQVIPDISRLREGEGVSLVAVLSAWVRFGMHYTAHTTGAGGYALMRCLRQRLLDIIQGDCRLDMEPLIASALTKKPALSGAPSEPRHSHFG